MGREVNAASKFEEIVSLNNSRTAAKEFLVKGNKAALKIYMKEISATIGEKGASSSFIKQLQENTENLGRGLDYNYASIIGSATNNRATVITNDKRMVNFMNAAELPVKETLKWEHIIF